MSFVFVKVLLSVLLVFYLVDFFKLLYIETDREVALVSHPSISDTSSRSGSSTDSTLEVKNISDSHALHAASPVDGSTVVSSSSNTDVNSASPPSVTAKDQYSSSSSTTGGSLDSPNIAKSSVSPANAARSGVSVSSTGSSDGSLSRTGNGNDVAALDRHPMNYNMDELYVPEGIGELPLETVKVYYRKLAKAYLATFKNGIYRQLYFDILRRRTYALTPPGANKGVQSMLFQIIDGKVYLMDPYEVPRNSKPFYRTRINEVIWLLSKLAGEGRIKNTEFLMSIHDCVQTVNKKHTYRGAHFQESNPAFTIVSCNFSDNIPFPMWEGSKHRDGGLSGWDTLMAQYAEDPTPWEQKTSRAVFRGGIRPSMYFQNKSDADSHCNDVGRTRLKYVAQVHPDLFDVSVGGTCGGKHSQLERLEPKEHHKFKYIVYAEGNCMWADRSRQQVFGPSAIIKQETPCGQFFEPMMKPFVHFIPTDFFFTDTAQRIQWARSNDEQVRTIVKNANEFARSFLSLRGIETYVEVLLQEYTALLVEPEIKLENGATEVTGKQV